ncbi:MAG: tryptophan synthase subunit beta [Candidatus Schekmanbacteria bacterium]|nr:tryptophan synthase subunit beta [Candidatus Schekmanbacteria bacterium]
MAPLEELAAEYARARTDPTFAAELAAILRDYTGRPTPLTFARRLSGRLSDEAEQPIRVYLKREDLCHTGAHKINNTLGQMILARRMGKRRIIAETGAGQHGVATAASAALFGFACRIYMGREDMRRQALNVCRMELMGATVVPVESGSMTLKDATSEAIRDWVTNVADTHYVIGSVVGPHPYPMMVRDFQSVIGRETREQVVAAEGRLPDVLVACVGGGSNAIGIFHPFLGDREVAMIGVEGGGYGPPDQPHAATLSYGEPGVLHGAMSYLLQEEGGQVALAHSISAGLDYPGVGPEHAYLKDSGRARYVWVSDRQAVAAVEALCRLEGILPALESAHAIAHLFRLAADVRERGDAAPAGRPLLIVACLSGRGDKDVETVQEALRAREASA